MKTFTGITALACEPLKNAQEWRGGKPLGFMGIPHYLCHFKHRGGIGEVILGTEPVIKNVSIGPGLPREDIKLDFDESGVTYFDKPLRCQLTPGRGNRFWDFMDCYQR